MPYIKKEDRIKFLPSINSLNPETAGELNFIISSIIKKYINNGNYQKCNDAIGALECSKMEIYRRFIGPYEDKKIEENGDID